MLANSFKLKGYTFGEDPSHIMLATNLLKADEGCAKSQNTYFDAFAQIFLVFLIRRHGTPRYGPDPQQAVLDCAKPMN